MKKSIITAIAFVTLVSTGYAQHGKMQDKHPKQQGIEPRKHPKGKMAHAINMTTEQKKQAQEIQKNFHEKLSKLKSNDKITMGEFKKQLASLEKERKTNMQALLTVEQKQKIELAKKRADENRQVKSVAMLERMKIRLELKDDQVAKIKTLQEQLHSKAKAIKENENLSSMERKDKMQQLAIERKNSMQSILTTEQQEKMQQFKPGKRQAR